MPNNHGYVNTMRCTCWDVDAFKAVGIYADGDLDNGVFVTLGKPVNTDGNVTGFEHTVTLPAANADHLWLIRTPEVGTTLESNLLNDPRTFYNQAGRPLSLCYMNPGVDVIEVFVENFATGNSPVDQDTYQYATIDTNGKMVMANAAPAQGTYFALEGKHYVPIGQEVVTSYMFRCIRN